MKDREISLDNREKEFKEDNKVFEVEIDFLKKQIEFYNELKNKFDAELSLAASELASANENLNWSELVSSSLVKEVNGGKQDLSDAQALNEEMRQVIDTLELECRNGGNLFAAKRVPFNRQACASGRV